MKTFPKKFVDLQSYIAGLPAFDEGAAAAARVRQHKLTKPPGSLGRLEELAVFMAGWRGRACPRIDRAHALVFAGNHGVCAQGVNVYPATVTAQMVANFAAGGAAINQLCKAAGSELSVIALDLDRPTRDLSIEDAMSETETLDAMRIGYEAVDRDADVLLLGEMGIGNSTVAAALACALFGGPASSWVGPGTGSDAEGIHRKAKVIENAMTRIAGKSPTTLTVLAAVGGREQAAICGAILGARVARIPVILDGFICTSAAAVLHHYGTRLQQAADLLAHCIAGHVGSEPGHRPLLTHLRKNPLLDLGLRLGEGSGAAVALTILKAALAAHNGMATFDEAGVSNR